MYCLFRLERTTETNTNTRCHETAKTDCVFFTVRGCVDAIDVGVLSVPLFIHRQLPGCTHNFTPSSPARRCPSRGFSVSSSHLMGRRCEWTSVPSRTPLADPDKGSCSVPRSSQMLVRLDVHMPQTQVCLPLGSSAKELRVEGPKGSPGVHLLGRTRADHPLPGQHQGRHRLLRRGWPKEEGQDQRDGRCF